MDEQWMNDLRKKMADHKTPAPEGLWEDIERAVNKRQPAPPPAKKRIGLWTAGWGAVAAALALFFWLNAPAPTVVPEEGAQLALTEEEKTEAADLSPEKTTGEKAAPETQWMAQAQPTRQVQDKGEYRKAAATSRSASKNKMATTDEEPATAFAESGDNHSEAMPKVQQKAIQKGTRAPQRRNRRTVDKRRLTAKSEKTWSPSLAPQRVQQQRLAVNLYAANLAHSTDYHKGYGELVAGRVLPEHIEQSFPQQTPAENIIYSNIGKEVHTYQKHKLPIKVGLAVRYHLTPRLSVESGLTYARLSSELTSGSETSHYVTDQRLDYLGIPLLLSFDVWKNRHWNFYVSGGGTLEKCVHGASDTDFVLHGETISTTHESTMEHPVQWAVNGAVGAQFNLNRHCGLYAEPGMSYYFDNGSPITNIYKDQPLNFNFKLGFRFTFH